MGEKITVCRLYLFLEIIAEGSGRDFDLVLMEVFLDIREKVLQVHGKANADWKGESGL